MLHWVPDAIPKPETVVQKRQRQKWKMKRAEIMEERRLAKITLCKNCGFYCSACAKNKKCCLERAKKEYKPEPASPEPERHLYPEEQGYAIGQGSQEKQWE